MQASIDEHLVVARPGDIIVIKPKAPHRFTAIGEGPLVAVYVQAHCSAKIYIRSGIKVC